MSENTARSVYSSYLELMQLLGKSPAIIESSTLNEKFNVHQDVTLNEGEIPSINGITIGNGAHVGVPGNNDVQRIVGVRRKPRAAALYHHLPFIMRDINDDLPPTIRDKYRMRRIEEHNGNQYVAYYVRAVDVTNIDPVIELRTVTNGEVVTTPFVPDSQDLNPIKPAIDNVNPGDGNYIAVLARIPFILDDNDVSEIVNAATIIHNDPSYAYISEMGLCTGVDRDLTGIINGVQTTYKESIYTQIQSSINTGLALNFGKPSQDTYFDLGTVESIIL